MVSIKMRSFVEIGFWTVLVSGILFVGVQESRIKSALEHLARPIQLFSPSMLVNNTPPGSEWNVIQSKDTHRFFYVASQSTCVWIGKGENCCTFNFANDRYVIKLMRFDVKRKKHGLIKRLICSLKQKKLSQRTKEALYSAKLCMEELGSQTGVVYAHLNPTKDLVPSFKLRDFYGQEFRVYGDDAYFVVQKKAVPFIKKISILMNNDDVDGAKRHIDQVLDLYVSLARKGYIQRDGFNVGFVEDRAIFIDVWHFEKMNRCSLLQRISYDARETLRPIESWLVSTYPSLGEYYQNRVKGLIAEIQKEEELH